MIGFRTNGKISKILDIPLLTMKGTNNDLGGQDGLENIRVLQEIGQYVIRCLSAEHCSQIQGFFCQDCKNYVRRSPSATPTTAMVTSRSFILVNSNRFFSHISTCRCNPADHKLLQKAQLQAKNHSGHRRPRQYWWRWHTSHQRKVDLRWYRANSDVSQARPGGCLG